MEKDSLWTPEFLCMSGSNLIFFMSQYVLVAALPIFIMDYLGGNEVQAGLAMTAFQIGDDCISDRHGILQTVCRAID